MKSAFHTAALLLVLTAACGGRVDPGPPPDAVVTRKDLTYAVEVGGRLVPREEIFVRPLVSGLLSEVRVRPGERVKKGHHLATVRIVSDPVLLAEARAAARRAQAALVSATRELQRVRTVEGGSGIAARDIAQAEDHERMARAELDAAQERAHLLAEGATAGRPGEAGARSTHVLAPVDGTVLAVPVAVGDFVSESNTYRDGTAVAILADMEALVFKGFVEEAHVHRHPALDRATRQHRDAGGHSARATERPARAHAPHSVHRGQHALRAVGRRAGGAGQRHPRRLHRRRRARAR